MNKSNIIEKFEDVREWGTKRGINKAEFQVQFQRLMQEVIEIHDAYNKNDLSEVKDGIGDSIVVLIGLARTVGLTAEDCLDTAFDVIELRKGINKNGSFVRYGKLNKEDKIICDVKQGNPGNEYYIREDGKEFNSLNFTKD